MAGEGLRGDFVEAVGAEIQPAVGLDEAGDIGTFWYLPVEDDRGYRITPVYVAVKEL